MGVPSGVNGPAHVMLDLESMGDDCISSIGLVVFDPYEEPSEDTDPPASLHVNVKWGSLEKYGIRPDERTIRWWLKQDAAAIDSLFKPEPVDIKEALHQVSCFWTEHGLKYLWSHSYYDAAVMIRLYKLIKGWFPWRGKDIRDYRTIQALSDKKMRQEFRPLIREGSVHHTAVDDAYNQARFVQFVLTRLRERGCKLDLGT